MAKDKTGATNAWGHIVDVGTSHCDVRLDDGRQLRVALACEYFYQFQSGERVCVSFARNQEPELTTYLTTDCD